MRCTLTFRYRAGSLVEQEMALERELCGARGAVVVPSATYLVTFPLHEHH